MIEEQQRDKIVEEERSFTPWYTRYIKWQVAIALLLSLGGLVVSQGFLYQERERERKVRVDANASTESDAPPEQALEPPPRSTSVLSSSPEIEPVPPHHARAFIVSDDWSRMPEPEPGDWVTMYDEPAQSFASYVLDDPNIVDQKRNVLYLRPTRGFQVEHTLELEVLREFFSIYFQLEARLAAPLDTSALTSRINPGTRKRQLHTTALLDAMIEDVPDDAYAVLALTSTDLYPEESWNFVFGQARFKDRVGVYSVARFYDEFFEPSAKTPPEVVMRRTLGIIAHETGHMFSMAHCKHFHCVLNGTNSLDESDRGTLHLCPVCLRKLYHAHAFDPLERYRQLQLFYEKHGLHEEAAWIGRRVDVLGEKRE